MAENYQVTHVAPTVIEDHHGRPVRGQVVTFKTRPTGMVGEVRVPDEDFTLENVHDRAARAAALLEDVKGL